MEELKPTTQEKRQEWMTLKTDAKPTPYFVVDHPAAWTIQTKPGGAGECVARNYGDSGKGNANYLVAAANALPRLVADVERLEDENKRLREALLKTNHLSDCNMMVPTCATCGTLVTVHKDFAYRKNCTEYKERGCTCGRDDALRPADTGFTCHCPIENHNDFSTINGKCVVCGKEQGMADPSNA